MAGFDERDKGKKKRTSQDRFAFHTCYHGDAWLGVDDLSGLATGIYWKIILRTYIKRAALLDDDADNARLFNESLKNYRRAKRELLAKGRIVCDDGLIFDERAVRELEALDRYRDKQAERANTRWKTEPPPPAPKPRVVVDNLVPVSPTSLQLLHEVGAKSASSQAPIIESMAESRCRSDAKPIPITHKQLEATSGAKRAAQPPRGGGALTHEEWMKTQRAALDPEVAGDEEQHDPSVGADRKAVRS